MIKYFLLFFVFVQSSQTNYYLLEAESFVMCYYLARYTNNIDTLHCLVHKERNIIPMKLSNSSLNKISLKTHEFCIEDKEGNTKITLPKPNSYETFDDINDLRTKYMVISKDDINGFTFITDQWSKSHKYIYSIDTNVFNVYYD